MPRATATHGIWYADFAAATGPTSATSPHINNHASVTQRHAQFMTDLAAWWQQHLPVIEALAPDADNQHEAIKKRAATSTPCAPRCWRASSAPSQAASAQPLSGTRRFRQLLQGLVSDFKSIAASGWGPELIPDEDILQSQFPQVLAELETQHARLAELQALFAAASEEDFEDTDDTGVLPADEVKTLKDELKEANAEWKAQLKTLKGAVADSVHRDQVGGAFAQGHGQGPPLQRWFHRQGGPVRQRPARARSIRLGGPCLHVASVIEAAMAAGQQAKATAERIEAKLATHKALEDEAKALKAAIKSTEAKKDELVEQARLKISKDEARQVIVERLGKLLFDSYRQYLRADQRACVAAVENLTPWIEAKGYAVGTARRQIEAERDAPVQSQSGAATAILILVWQVDGDT
jgi:type I restriction enzyme M protein